MPKPKSFLRSRSLAFARQGGRYYYCASPMWMDSAAAFAVRYRVTLAQARQFQCTGEHLVARQEGGDNTATNVVAACRYCNAHRHQHRPTAAPSATLYIQRVQRRMSQGRWFGAVVLPAQRRPRTARVSGTMAADVV